MISCPSSVPNGLLSVKGWHSLCGRDSVADRAPPLSKALQSRIAGASSWNRESSSRTFSLQGQAPSHWHAHVQTVPHAVPPVGAGAFPATTIAATPPFRAIPHATAADATAAMRIGPGANIAASAAVIGIGIQDAALAVALHRPFDAGVVTAACDALAEFKGTRVGAAEAATAAVVEVVFQVGAISPAARLAEVAAIVAAGSAVRVGMQIAACAVASRGGTTGVIAT